MKFEDLKDAVCGVDILINGVGLRDFFIGICDGRLITMEISTKNVSEWTEYEIANWTIEKPKPKLRGPYWHWEHLWKGDIYETRLVDDCFCSVDGSKDNYISESKWKRKISNPIYIDNETGIPCDENGEVLK